MIEPSDAPLTEIIAAIQARLAAGAQEVTLRVLDPDRGRGRYAGERVDVDGEARVHRPLRVWLDLAERLGLRLRTPRPTGEHWLELRLERLDPATRWERPVDGSAADASERYGQGSAFSRISRLDDPGLILDMADALERASLPSDARILALGVNAGDELALILALAPALAERARFVGVDHSASALARARARFPGPRFEFIEADLNDLAALEIGAFDLALSIGTLQSPGVDDRALLHHLIQARLGRRGALILGIPNCRYLDGEQLYGARMKNFRQPDLSLVIDDVSYYRRYLHQHRRQVFVTGKSYVLVTAIPREKETQET